ncbi:phosphorylase [Novosphingobium sp. Chol11]|uniref:phosphorylase family protein n=1 Tax=Novosphingobium sp. Chol11 TaxID=1385763 RepID=UPI0025F15B52|nr:phosphorylase [Novosphingobium sp. Chol11]
MGHVSGAILVATGTKREAATLTQSGFLVIPGGGDAAALTAKLIAAAPGARGVMSFGFAGALDDALKLGDWVIGERVAGAAQATCDPAWAQTLAAQIPGARRGACYADGRLIADASEKRELGQRGLLAADMESHIAAQIAVELDLPFAIVRCVSDEARHILPPAIAHAMRPDGGVDGWSMLGSVLRKPQQLPNLAGTISGFLRAMTALKQGAAYIRPC